jgi:hypothetical protein
MANGRDGTRSRRDFAGSDSRVLLHRPYRRNGGVNCPGDRDPDHITRCERMELVKPGAMCPLEKGHPRGGEPGRLVARTPRFDDPRREFRGRACRAQGHESDRFAPFQFRHPHDLVRGLIRRPSGLHQTAQLARVFPVKGFRDRRGEGVFLGEAHDHPRPRHTLHNSPMQSQRESQEED